MHLFYFAVGAVGGLYLFALFSGLSMPWFFWLSFTYFSLGFVRALQLFNELTTTIQGKNNVDEHYKLMQKTIKSKGLDYVPSKDWVIMSSCLQMFIFWLPALIAATALVIFLVTKVSPRLGDS